MNKYEKQILNSLLDKYEKSKSFIGTNQVKQSFSIGIVQMFPKYEDDSNYELFCEINKSVLNLESLNFVKVKRQRNGVLQSVALSEDSLEKIYEYIERTPKRDIVHELKRLLQLYSGSNEILSTYCHRQLERLESNKSVEFYDDILSYESILKVVSKITEVEDEIFERDFSIQILNDSKAFEKIRSKVISLLYEYGDFPEKETILADLNIIKNPGHVYFKGKGKLIICGQTIDFSKMDGDFAISSSMLKNVETIDVTGNTVITIENLTSFNAFCCDESFAIYLGGYHNANRRDFIKKVYQQNPEKKYLHFGDIDAGGFYILKHLRERTGIGFEPYLMNLQTLKNNIHFTKKLTDNDRKRLTALFDTELGETILFMLENNCKLEQEATDLSGVKL